MQRNKEALELLGSIITKVRSFHGEELIPQEIQALELYHLIGVVQEHRRMLKRSGSDMGLYEIVKRVCVARHFDLDTIYNKVLARAYHIAVMNYFGNRRSVYAREKSMRRKSFESLLEQPEGGNE